MAKRNVGCPRLLPSFGACSGIARLVSLFAAVLLTSCVLYRPNWSQFRTLCENPSHTFIAKRVKADGYLREDASCAEDWRYLIDYGFAYCEGYERLGGTVTLYRVSIAEEGTPGCQEFRVFGPSSQMDPYRDQIEGKCLLKQRAEHPWSTYKLMTEIGVVRNDGRHVVTASKDDMRGSGSIGFARHQLASLSDGEVIAQKTQYSWSQVGGGSAPAPMPIMCSPSARAEPITGFLLRAISETNDPVR
jgi:hypothetical protein